MGVKNHRLTDTKIGSAKVTVDILPSGRCIPGDGIKIEKITIHDTGNTGDAKNQHNYLRNNNKSSGRNAKASWHISVDDKDIYQAVAFNKKAWHCKCGNSYSIGIEISQRANEGAQRQAYLNAIALTKILMHAYNIPVSRVVRHKDWTGKDCPYNLNHNKFGMNWEWFKKQLSEPVKIKKEKIDTAIVYANDIDKIAAEVLHWKKKKAILLNVKDISKYNIEHIFAIGVAANSIKAEVKITGVDRFDTMQKVLNYIK